MVNAIANPRTAAIGDDRLHPSQAHRAAVIRNAVGDSDFPYDGCRRNAAKAAFRPSVGTFTSAALADFVWGSLIATACADSRDSRPEGASSPTVKQMPSVH